MSNVCKHGDLRVVLADTLWQVTWSLPGLPISRNMLIYRKPGSQELTLYSVVAMDNKTMPDLEKLGTVTTLVVPCAFHTADIAAYKERYPSAKVVCSTADREAVEKLVSVGGVTEEEFAADKAESTGITALWPRGLKSNEPVLALEVAGGAVALLFCDLLMNLDPKSESFKGRIFGMVGGTMTPIRVSRIVRKFIVSDKKAVKGFLSGLVKDVGRPIAAIGVCHGQPETEGCEEKIAAAAQRL